jgi:hypothetical protein
MRERAFGLLLATILVFVVAPARADWLQPDNSYREAQLMLRLAVRDTADHPNNPAKLDSVGVALLRLARFKDAKPFFHRVLELAPGDDVAEAGLGKMALFEDRAAEAESLLSQASPSDELVIADLFAARLRLGRWQAAADLAPAVGQEGRHELLMKLVEKDPYEVNGPQEVTVPFTSVFPVAIIRAKLNGQNVLMAVDTGASDLLLDEAAFRVEKVTPVPGQVATLWNGGRMPVDQALVRTLEIGGISISNCPAGVLNLGKWSLEVNPHGEKLAGVIGLNLLRRFTPTLDFKKQKLTLRRPGVAFTPRAGAKRIPFQIWGESEMTVFGSIAQGRPMAMIVETALSGAGVGAPPEVFDELGLKPGAMSRMVKGAGQYLQGRPWYAVTVPTITVGQVNGTKLPAWYGALDSAEMWRHGVRRDAILAGLFFKDRVLTIDWGKHELVVEE